MSADKHFNAPGPVPEIIEDHKPDDMPAARNIGLLVMALLVVCTVITAVIYGRYHQNGDMQEPVAPIERPAAP